MDEQFTELLDFFCSANLFCQEGELDDVEGIFVEVVCFFEVFLLHLESDAALFAVVACCQQKLGVRLTLLGV